MSPNPRLPVPYEDLAHTLRAPLTVLRTTVALSRNKPPTLDTWREMNTIVDEQVILLSNIIDDIDLLIKYDQKTLKPGNSKVIVADVVEDVIKRSEQVAKDREIKIYVSAEENSFSVEADRDHISKLIQRLLDNSLRDGASKVELIVNEDSVVISDDGLGTRVVQSELTSKTPKYSRRSGIGFMTAEVIASLYSLNIEVSTGTNGSKIILKHLVAQ